MNGKQKSQHVSPGKFLHEAARTFLILVFTGLLLAGCGSGSDPSGSGSDPSGQVVAGESIGTPVPTPTRDPSGYQGVPSRGCLVSDWTTVQSNRAQGNFLAWQPQPEEGSEQANLAYITPNERSSWFTGNLMLAHGPDYQKRVPLAENILAAGDLTWSPSGETLAFLAYRVNEGLYTVMTVQADGSGLTDLFPEDTARTDNRSSIKAILDWTGEDTLQVISSCGDECRLAYEIQFSTPVSPEVTPEPVDSYRTLNVGLQIDRRELEYEPEQFPKNMRSPHWSPDDSLIAYLDKRGFQWVLNVQEKITYPLDLGLRDIQETQWSTDSQNLAVRAEDRIFVFEVPCRQAGQ